MKLSQLLLAIEKLASDNGLSRPFIVGGLARDKYMGRTNDFHDIDLTTGDSSVHQLAKLVKQKLSNHSNLEYKVMQDGHARIVIDGIKIDFSSNFMIPGIKSILSVAGISNPTEMQKELYSRDFTCNTMLMTLDLKEILDPTGLAIPDIQESLLTTCLQPELTLGHDFKRIPRAFYMASKLEFSIDPKVATWIANHPEAAKKVKPEYFAKKINKAFKYNLKETALLLKKTNLLNYVKTLPSLL